MTRTLEGLSELGNAVIAGLLLLILALLVQTPLVPRPQAAAVVLEGIVVTPTRVYDRTQWGLSRPVPSRVAGAASPPRPQQG